MRSMLPVALRRDSYDVMHEHKKRWLPGGLKVADRRLLYVYRHGEYRAYRFRAWLLHGRLTAKMRVFRNRAVE